MRVYRTFVVASFFVSDDFRSGLLVVFEMCTVGGPALFMSQKKAANNRSGSRPLN